MFKTIDRSTADWLEMDRRKIFFLDAIRSSKFVAGHVLALFKTRAAESFNRHRLVVWAGRDIKRILRRAAAIRHTPYVRTTIEPTNLTRRLAALGLERPGLGPERPYAEPKA